MSDNDVSVLSAVLGVCTDSTDLLGVSGVASVLDAWAAGVLLLVLGSLPGVLDWVVSTEASLEAVMKAVVVMWLGGSMTVSWRCPDASPC